MGQGESQTGQLIKNESIIFFYKWLTDLCKIYHIDGKERKKTTKKYSAHKDKTFSIFIISKAKSKQKKYNIDNKDNK